MKRNLTTLCIVLALLGLAFALFLASRHGTMVVLDPKGTIGDQERHLILLSTLLMLVVVVPVFVMTAFIVWKYRAEKNAEYRPDWDHHVVAESIWWGLPLVIITILAVVTWNSSHSLDPFKPITSSKPPLTIQVVALQWKWLFIYPDQRIATVNQVEFPVDTPIKFEITADAPMNSFWVPQLGGQMYAMPGMDSQLNLMASQPGTYTGVSANISGAGFAGMSFAAIATSSRDFNAWVRQVQSQVNPLTLSTYHALAQPSENVAPTFYSWAEQDLYNTVIMEYMDPNHHEHSHTNALPAAVYLK